MSLRKANMFSLRLVGQSLARIKGCASISSSSVLSFRGQRVVDDTPSRQDFGIERVKTKTGVLTVNLRAIVASKKVLGVDEWRSIKRQAVTEWGARESNFESQMMVVCSFGLNYSLASSLMDFIRFDDQQKSANLVTLAKYLRLCADSPEQCGEMHILDAYNELIKRHKMFDVMTVADIVHGLCHTSRWKESLPYVDTIQLTCSSPPTSILEDLALAAFRNREHDEGWKFLQRVTATNKTLGVSDDAYIKLLRLASTDLATMERLFAYMRERDVIVSEAVAMEIKSWFQWYHTSMTDNEWRGDAMRVDDRGVCAACGTQLENVRLNDADFETLRSNFISRVIEGSDVYLKTNPYELQKFTRFVTRTSPYSIVLDGLNVAFNAGKFNVWEGKQAEQLLTCVRQLHRENSRKMMILGRHHMSKWPKAIMKQIEQLAHVFYIDNNSKDDPFMLYAAMHSGQGTYFVSKDLMRDHLFSLQDASLQALFKQWQAGNQLHLLPNSSLHLLKFKTPVCHRVVVQRLQSESQTGWHVPYEDGSTRLTHEIPNTWLCLSRDLETRSNQTLALPDSKMPSVKSKPTLQERENK